MPESGRKNILIVTLHFDPEHIPVRRRFKLPQGMGAVFLAGAFSEKTCNIKVYSELYSGPLEDRKVLAWADMVVMTGVTNCLDRMLHIAAYAKSVNMKVLTVVGGPAIRAFPRFASRFFDYCCTGDIEQLQDVITDAYGPEYLAEEMTPRLDLAYWIGMHGHAETSRYCQYHCDFCSLTGERVRYRRYSIASIRRQLEVMGKRRTVHFIDNNFYGNDRDFFLARLELINDFRRRGRFRYWSALVTGDFFADADNLRLAQQSGCVALFSGVESFDRSSLEQYKKMQNLVVPQIQMIEATLEHGIAFWYGLFADVYNRPLSDIADELGFLFSRDSVSLPGFISIPIPLPGTPYFQKCLNDKLFLPMTRLRHLDGTTLCMAPHDDLPEVVAFLQALRTMKGKKRQIASHACRFIKHYRAMMKPEAIFYALASNILMLANPFSRASRSARTAPTHVTTTELLESTYIPKFHLESRYEHYFKPTYLTDMRGELNEELLPDLEQADVPYLMATPSYSRIAGEILN